jgi:hypothetical protein
MNAILQEGIGRSVHRRRRRRWDQAQIAGRAAAIYLAGTMGHAVRLDELCQTDIQDREGDRPMKARPRLKKYRANRSHRCPRCHKLLRRRIVRCPACSLEQVKGSRSIA